jgi:multidrug resistance efflux pump
MRIKNTLFVFLFISLVSCGGKDESFQPQRNTITETVFAAGSLVAVDRYNLTAQSEGYIQSIAVKEGETVSLGQNIAEINNTSSEAAAAAAAKQLQIAQLNTQKNAPAIQEAKANAAIAQQKMAQEEKNYQRYQQLATSQSVSTLEVENAKLSFETAQSNHAAAQQRLALVQQQAELSLAAQQAQQVIQSNAAQYNHVSALSEGLIVKLNKKVGDFVKKGDVIAVMASPKAIVAQLNVDENSIRKVQLGQKVHVQLNVNKDKVLEGIVTTIYPLYDEATQSFLCDVVLKDNLDFGILGTRLEANIDIVTRENALLIPRKYLSYQNTVQLKGEKEPKAIEVGIRSTEWVEVLSGISENDIIVPLKK